MKSGSYRTLARLNRPSRHKKCLSDRDDHKGTANGMRENPDDWGEVVAWIEVENGSRLISIYYTRD